MSITNRLSLWGIYTIWYRGYRSFQKTLITNCLLPMSESVIYLIGFGYGMMPVVKDVLYDTVYVDYFRFLAPGMIGVGVLFQSFFESAYGTFMRFEQQKIWHVRLTAPLTFDEVFAGEWLWAVSRGMLSGILTSLVAILLGAYPVYALIPTLPVLFLGAMVFSALGLATAALVRKIDEINVPIFVLIVPMFALSGTYFPMDGLPLAMKWLASILPFYAFVRLLRWPLLIPGDWLLCVLSLCAWLVCLGVIAYKSFHRRMFP